MKDKETLVHLYAKPEFFDFIEVKNSGDFILTFDYDERDKIEDVDNFKRELERQGLMSRALEEFIENYMRFDNE